MKQHLWVLTESFTGQVLMMQDPGLLPFSYLLIQLSDKLLGPELGGHGNTNRMYTLRGSSLMWEADTQEDKHNADS